MKWQWQSIAMSKFGNGIRFSSNKVKSVLIRTILTKLPGEKRGFYRRYLGFLKHSNSVQKISDVMIDYSCRCFAAAPFFFFIVPGIQIMHNFPVIGCPVWALLQWILAVVLHVEYGRNSSSSVGRERQVPLYFTIEKPFQEQKLNQFIRAVRNKKFTTVHGWWGNIFSSFKNRLGDRENWAQW